jgi:hypothetical protein
LDSCEWVPGPACPVRGVRAKRMILLCSRRARGGRSEGSEGGGEGGRQSLVVSYVVPCVRLARSSGLARRGRAVLRGVGARVEAGGGRRAAWTEDVERVEFGKFSKLPCRTTGV